MCKTGDLQKVYDQLLSQFLRVQEATMSINGPFQRHSFQIRGYWSLLEICSKLTIHDHLAGTVRDQGPLTDNPTAEWK
jgi:hypothetical protein